MQGMKRRSSNSRNEVGNIWDVVSSLAQALTDARDQLVGLINYDGNAKGFKHCHGKENIHRSVGEGNVHHTDNAVAVRFRGGGNCGNYVPSNKKVSSVHRQHARGHVAFGNHSEFKPEPPSKAGKPVTMALNYCSPRGKGSGKPVAGKKGAQLYLDSKSNSLQINCNKGGCDPLSIFIPKSPCPPQYTRKKDSNCRSPSPSPASYECKRHCIGTQYAALLREEACRIRERRLAKKCERTKPRWARC